MKHGLKGWHGHHGVCCSQTKVKPERHLKPYHSRIPIHPRQRCLPLRELTTLPSRMPVHAQATSDVLNAVT